MNRLHNFLRTALSALAWFCATGGAAFAGDAPTLLALGDSITSGGNGFVCYREVLVPELRSKKIKVEFIGPKKDAVSAHAGYSGRSTKQLLEISRDVYKRFPADIVLLHSGHNSFSNDQPVPRILRDTETMIQQFREVNPRVTVLLAQVIPSGKLPKYGYISELNRELSALATRLDQPESRVISVNQAEGFDWRHETVADKVHPNAPGAKKMAEKWLQAILPLIGTD